MPAAAAALLLTALLLGGRHGRAAGPTFGTFEPAQDLQVPRI
jgi:hypothetical protein